jgi:hypothetical protein
MYYIYVVIYKVLFKTRVGVFYQIGASVAKWLAHLPFTPEAAGSSLSENFLNATRTQSSCEKSKKSTLCRKSWVSSGYSGSLPQGKLTGWVRQKGPQ